MTDYEWLTEMGLCHKCRKEKAAPNKKFCFGCLDKIKEENAKRYDREKARRYQKRRREIYRNKIENGICVRCSRRATHGIYCYEHLIMQRRRSAERAQQAKEERHEKGLVPLQREKDGLCIWCGKKAVSGTNACERHREIFSEAGKRAKGHDSEVNGYWKLTTAKNLGST